MKPQAALQQANFGRFLQLMGVFPALIFQERPDLGKAR